MKASWPPSTFPWALNTASVMRRAAAWTVISSWCSGWGNMVGSRDVDSPDGDHRFFKEKIDELPEDLLAEVQQRNNQYVVWLAEHLQG